MNNIHIFEAETLLKAPLDTVWDFFSSASNLARITPPEMDFKILGNVQGDIYEGMLINYRVRPLFGIGVFWQTEISEVKKPHEFTDRQLKGPYSMWEHTHTFNRTDQGVLMKDVVRYSLPLGFLGDIAHAVIVKRKIADIFRFRENILRERFNHTGWQDH